MCLQRRMRDEEMPDHRLVRFGMRRDALSIDWGHDDADIRGLRGVAAIAADDAEDRRASVLRGVDRMYERCADLLLGIAATDREDQHRVGLRHARSLQPLRVRAVPPI